MGRGRDRGRLAEGLDAAAGSVFQRGEREGAQSGAVVEAAEVLLGLGRNDRRQQDRLFSLYARDQSALWAARGHRHAAGRRLAPSVRARRAPGAWKFFAPTPRNTATPSPR